MRILPTVVCAVSALLLVSCAEILVPERETARVGSDAASPERERLWTVTCGLPQQDDPLLALLPTGGYTGPWPGGQVSGHLEVKMLNRRHPEGSISTEMWVLSRTVGWWRLKTIRVHPDDMSKVSEKTLEHPRFSGVRQIVESPFLAEPAVIMGVDEENLVNGQILALMADASGLECAP